MSCAIAIHSTTFNTSESALAAVHEGVHRAALLGADVVVMPEGVGSGPDSLRDFEALAVAARVAIAATFIDDGEHPSEHA